MAIFLYFLKYSYQNNGRSQNGSYNTALAGNILIIKGMIIPQQNISVLKLISLHLIYLQPILIIGLEHLSTARDSRLNYQDGEYIFSTKYPDILYALTYETVQSSNTLEFGELKSLILDRSYWTSPARLGPPMTQVI